MENSIEEKLHRLLANSRFFQTLLRGMGTQWYGEPETAVAEQFAFGFNCPYFEFVLVDAPDNNFWYRTIRQIKVVRTTITSPANFAHIGLAAPFDPRAYRIILTTQDYVRRLGENTSQGRTAIFAVDHLRDNAQRQGFWDNYIREWIRSKVSLMIM